MSYNNETETLIFKPTSKQDRGKTCQFSIFVKDPNSDSVMTEYMATVRVNEVPTIDVSFEIRNLYQPNPL